MSQGTLVRVLQTRLGWVKAVKTKPMNRCLENDIQEHSYNGGYRLD